MILHPPSCVQVPSLTVFRLSVMIDHDWPLPLNGLILVFPSVPSPAICTNRKVPWLVHPSKQPPLALHLLTPHLSESIPERFSLPHGQPGWCDTLTQIGHSLWPPCTCMCLLILPYPFSELPLRSPSGSQSESRHWTDGRVIGLHLSWASVFLSNTVAE